MGKSIISEGKTTKSKAERERIGKWEPERMENGNQ